MSWLLDFTIENADDAARITAAYRRMLDGRDACVPGSMERFDTGVE